ncbi:MAG TPA: hypothetical protein VEU62_13905 [Bryobacterales bacterium]|nr:hypothetical protein [Bryobacterales bacterium]
MPTQGRWWLPPLGEVVFASMLLWLLLGGQASVLLADGDTGWHIRTGDTILATGRFPTHDLFSFSRPGAPWFAWEWLSDVLFSLANRAAGLKGVVLLAAMTIAATSAVLFEFLLWQRVNVLVAIFAMFAAGSASTVHWLARPHVFTCLLFVVSLWLLEADRRRRSPWVWMLAPLGALWANLHGGFVALPAMLAIYALGAWWDQASRPRPRDWGPARRYAALLAAVAAATLLNPYGYRLHQHIASYLRSDFIRNAVEEFQSPRFRGESMLVFELLLIGGLLAVPSLWRRRDYAPALLVVALAHAALGSVRHVLLYVLAATPVAAAELTRRLEGAPGGWAQVLAELASDYAPRPGAQAGLRFPAWGLAAAALALALLNSGPPRWRVEFPPQKFPQQALARTEKEIVGRRIFTSDQWGDYLIYRFYPHVRVFIDGRSDFYGAALGREYLEAQQGQHRWEEIFKRYGFEVALVPVEWPLASLLKADPEWRLAYDDGHALVMTRTAPSTLAGRTD